MKRFKRSPNFSGLSRMMLLVVLVSAAGLLFAQTLPNPPELIPYRKGDKWGFCDRNEKIVIECKYDGALSFSEGLAGVKLNDKWGFIDKTGKEVVPPKYDLVRNFSEGLAAIKSDGKWGYVDKTGKMIIPPRYDGAWNFSEGLAVIELNGKCGYIDKRGKEVIPIKYDRAFPFSEGKAVVAVGDLSARYGYVDKTGKEVISLRYNNALPFSKGRALVQLNNKWGYIDANENEQWEGVSSSYNIFDVVSYGKYAERFRVELDIQTLYNVAKWEQIEKFINSNKDFFYNLGIISIESKGDVRYLQNLLNEKLKFLGFIIETGGIFGVELYAALEMLIKMRKLGLENVKNVEELQKELNTRISEQGVQDTLKIDGIFTSKTMEIIEDLSKIQDDKTK